MNEFEEIEYSKRAEDYLNSLDFEKFNQIKLKELLRLTDEELEFIGLRKQSDPEYPNLYCYTNLDDIKIYFTKAPDRFELRGFKLKKIKDVFTTTELLDETLTKWRLKIK